MPYITNANKESFIGKTVDCVKRLYHYYPLMILKRPYGYVYRDITGTNILFDKNEKLYYDFIVEE